MGPRRVKLELIPSLSTRMATFRKRKKSMFKKLDEIKKLCGIDACAVVKNPLDGKMEAWPSEAAAKFSMNQESHLRKTILNFGRRLENKNNDIVSDFMVNGLGMEHVGFKKGLII